MWAVALKRRLAKGDRVSVSLDCKTCTLGISINDQLQPETCVMKPMGPVSPVVRYTEIVTGKLSFAYMSFDFNVYAQTET